MGVVLRQLDMDESEALWEWIPLSSAIIEAVEDAFRNLPRDVFLRTGDAVHLISARAHGFAEIYSNDKHLLRAAPHLGLMGPRRDRAVRHARGFLRRTR